jgi:hypothetical protein
MNWEFEREKVVKVFDWEMREVLRNLPSFLNSSLYLWFILMMERFRMLRTDLKSKKKKLPSRSTLEKEQLIKLISGGLVAEFWIDPPNPLYTLVYDITSSRWKLEMFSVHVKVYLKENSSYSPSEFKEGVRDNWLAKDWFHPPMFVIEI